MSLNSNGTGRIITSKVSQLSSRVVLFIWIRVSLPFMFVSIFFPSMLSAMLFLNLRKNFSILFTSAWSEPTSSPTLSVGRGMPLVFMLMPTLSSRILSIIPSISSPLFSNTREVRLALSNAFINSLDSCWSFASFQSLLSIGS